MNSNNQIGVGGLLSRMILSSLMMISTLIVFGTSQAHAVGEPAFSWLSDDNQVVAGVASFGASATPTSPATIKKWCLTFDGSPVTTNVATYNSTYYYDIYYDTTFSAQTGCWSSSTSNLRTAKVKWDTTTWAPGPHTLQWTVTDTSNRSVTSNVLTFTTSNASPAFSWLSDDNQVVAGAASFAASVTPSVTGTATIKKWCLTFDGSPVTTNVATYNSTYYYDIYYDTTFSAQTGCWSSSTSNLRTAKVKWDTTTWAPGPHTLQWTVTDTSNRSVTSNVLTFSASNPQPYMVIGNLSPGQVLTGNAEVYLAAMHPGASFVSSYFFVDVAPRGSGEDTSVYPQFTTVRKVVLDTTKMRNGNHIFVGLVNDSAGRQVWSSIIPFSTNNSASSIRPLMYHVPQAWPSKAINSYVVGSFSNTDSIIVRYGTNKGKLGLPITLPVTNGASPLAISGLKASTTYYFEITGIGLNGNSPAVIIQSKTPPASKRR